MELKSCPFCDGRVQLDVGQHYSRILCLDCGARGPLCETDLEAVRKWNTRGNFGNTRIALVNPLVPIETFKLIERLRESVDRLERGDFDAADRGVLLLMRGKVLTTVMLRTDDRELRDMAQALVSAIDAKTEMLR